MNSRGIAVLFAIFVASVALSGAAVADPGEHEVNVTDGTGTVNASYQYDASTGNITATYGWGSEEISLGNPNESALAIQWAIDNSTSTRETVLIGPGTYNGSVEARQSNRSLRAVDGPAVTRLAPTSNPEAQVINVTASNITIENITISGHDETGIYLSGVDGITINDSIIRGGTVGVFVDYGSDGNVFYNNSVKQASQAGYYLRGSNRIEGGEVGNTGNGIFIHKGIHTVTGVTVGGSNWGGIEVHSDGNTISDNRIVDSDEQGIEVLSRNAHQTILNNTLLNNSHGIDIRSSDGNTIVGNNASNNRENGIELNSSSSNVVIDNTALNNGYGIRADGDSNEFRRNIVGDNPYAGLSYVGHQNEVTNNTFVRNGNGLLGNGNSNTHRGNYASENVGAGISLGGDDSTFRDTITNNNSGAGLRIQTFSQNVTIENATAINNSDEGIFVAADTVTVSKSTVSRNGLSGIASEATQEITIRDTVTSNNTKSGVWVNESVDATLDTVTANGNTIHGIWITNNSDRAIVDSGTALNNDQYNVYLLNSSNATVNHSTASGMTIIGAPRTTLRNNTVTTSSVYLSRGSDYSVIDGNDVDHTAAAGLYLLRSENLSITGNTINGTSFGIYLSTETENFTVTSNEITNNSIGIWVSGVAGDNHTIRTNTARNNQDGLRLDTSNTVVENNTAESNTRYGIWFEGGSANEILNNDVRYNDGTGINLTAVNDSTVRSNTALNNVVHGIHLQNANNNTVEQNDVLYNIKRGISIERAEENVFRSNRANGNEVGIYAPEGARNNTFHATTVNDNAEFGINLGEGASGNVFHQPTARNNLHAGYVAWNVDGSNELYGLDIIPDPSSGVTYDIEAKNVSIATFDGSVGTPSSDYDTVGGLINVTNTTSAATVDLTAQYNDSDVSNVDESSIGFWNYTNATSSWTEVNGETVDTGNNSASRTVTAPEVFGLYAESTSSSSASGGGGGGGFFPAPSGNSGPNVSITSIDLASTEVAVDEPVAVTIELENAGDEHGDYTGTLTADGQEVDSETVTVNANWHETLTLSTSFDEAGTYQLAVDGQAAGSVDVTAEQVTGEPSFAVSDVSMDPTTVEAGETVTISATVTNDGEAHGTTDVPLIVDGEEVDSESVTLGPGESATVTFERTFDEPGSVTIGGVTAGSVEVQDSTTDSAGDSDESGGSDGGASVVLILLGGLGLVGAGGAGAYLLYPDRVQTTVERLRVKADELLETYRE